MENNEYQKLSARTLLEKPDFEIRPEQVMIVWNAIGLGGEAGEVLDLIKKGIFHQQGIDLIKLKKELGDVLWYLSALCTQFGFTLDDVMETNIEKLKARFPNGYNATDTLNKSGIAE